MAVADQPANDGTASRRQPTDARLLQILARVEAGQMSAEDANEQISELTSRESSWHRILLRGLLD